MRPWLAEQNIDVIAMCHAPAKAVRAQIERDGIGFPILIDTDLTISRQLGWFDRAGLKHVTWRMFGVPIGFPVGFRRMPRPATVLIDETGLVQWLDVTDDYRLRGDEDTIREGVAAAFPGNCP